MVVCEVSQRDLVYADRLIKVQKALETIELFSGREPYFVPLTLPRHPQVTPHSSSVFIPLTLSID